MTQQTNNPQLIHNALRSIPNATFVLTCKYEQHRDGIITRWVQQCSTEPPMLVVAITKGRTIEPMLRDARAFALCMVPPNDRTALRLFGTDHEPDEDPLLSLSTKMSVTGMPILQSSIVWFDCKLEGHLSPDADCRLYLGQVLDAHICDKKKLTSLSETAIQAPIPDARKAPRSSAKKITRNYKQ